MVVRVKWATPFKLLPFTPLQQFHSVHLTSGSASSLSVKKTLQNQWSSWHLEEKWILEAEKVQEAKTPGWACWTLLLSGALFLLQENGNQSTHLANLC